MNKTLENGLILALALGVGTLPEWLPDAAQGWLLLIALTVIPAYLLARALRWIIRTGS